jgi:hypothetical protein
MSIFLFTMFLFFAIDQRPGFPYNNLAYHHRRPHPLSATTAGTGQLRGSNPDNNHGSPPGYYMESLVVDHSE